MHNVLVGRFLQKDTKKIGYSPIFQTVKKPIREVWRAVALQMQSESGDMCGGFASLRSKVSLHCFPPGRLIEPRGKQCKYSEKDAAGGLFRHAEKGFGDIVPKPLLCFVYSVF